ncbi:MAG: tripartite tricarboxylate transporter substrate binding protein [Burkholderiales bacterium]
MPRLILAFMLVMLGCSSFAADFPDQAVRIIVPTPPGGSSDALARILSAKLQELWGQPVIVETKSGQQGSIGIAYALKQKPDGYTIATLPMGATVINPFLYDNVGYRTPEDLAPLARVSEQSFIWVANPNVPVQTLKELEALARSKPGALTYASTGAAPQIVGEYFKTLTKTDMLHIRYPGAGPALIAVMSGTTDFLIASPSSVLQHIKSGKLRAIAIIGKERNPSVPDVPSAVESGFPQLSDLTEWSGYALPANTPPEIVRKINADFAKALADPAVQASIRNLGMTPAHMTPETFGKLINSDLDRWGKLVQLTDIKKE